MKYDFWASKDSMQLIKNQKTESKIELPKFWNQLVVYHVTSKGTKIQKCNITAPKKLPSIKCEEATKDENSAFVNACSKLQFNKNMYVLLSQDEQKRFLENASEIVDGNATKGAKFISIDEINTPLAFLNLSKGNV